VTTFVIDAGIAIKADEQLGRKIHSASLPFEVLVLRDIGPV
jgi:hypothetical protein